MKQEQPLFCVGDKAVCVDSTGQTDLVEGKKYTITSVIRTTCCGAIGVSVGIKGDFKNHRCVTCNRTMPYTGYNIYKQNRFAPANAMEQIESQVFEALKGQKSLQN